MSHNIRTRVSFIEMTLLVIVSIAPKNDIYILIVETLFRFHTQKNNEMKKKKLRTTFATFFFSCIYFVFWIYFSRSRKHFCLEIVLFQIKWNLN